MNKAKVFCLTLVGMLILFSSCKGAAVATPTDQTTPTTIDNPTASLSEEQILRKAIEGSYTSDHCSGLPGDMSGSYVMLMPYFDDFSSFDVDIYIHSDKDCASQPIGLLEIPAQTTFGAVKGETDQNFTAEMDYLGEQVTVQKMNLTYLGAYLTVYSDDTIFGITKDDGKADVSELFLQGKTIEFGALYRIDDSHFVTNINMRDPESKIVPDDRTTDDFADTIWAKE